jgi:hypothetical protein
MATLFIVDCEANGKCPATGKLTEFGVVNFSSFMKGQKQTFHGILDEERIALRKDSDASIVMASSTDPAGVFLAFDKWLAVQCRDYGDYDPPVFVSDNPAFDWQWINDGFWRHCRRNPFGHSARRIGDFYAGLVQDFHASSKWKKFRITEHDHNPVHDALGNAEALKHILQIAGSGKALREALLGESGRRAEVPAWNWGKGTNDNQ